MNILELFKEWDPEIYEHAIHKDWPNAMYTIEDGYLLVTLPEENLNRDFCFITSSFFDGWTLVKKKIEREGWVNIYPNNIVGGKIYRTEEKANDSQGSNRVACIKINWEE